VILFGVEKSIEVYNSVRKRPRRSGRAESSQRWKIIAAVDPACHANRKLRIAAKHKRRKVMAMKIGWWMR
jgi:U3 small nucleolar RNA-associated protein 20